MHSLILQNLYDPTYDRKAPAVLRRNKDGIWVQVTGSHTKVHLPSKMTGKLAYLIGVIVGDGYISGPIKRRTHGPGFHWKVVVTGPHDYVVEIRKHFSGLFCVNGGLQQDSRKKDSWQLRFGNLILNRFFARVIGLPQGRKTTHKRWSRLELVENYPVHFLSGLIDSDGHVGRTYIGIIQKDIEFLKAVQRFVMTTLGLNFHGPYVNKRRNGVITSWIISLFKNREREELVHAKNRLTIGLKCTVPE